MTAAAFGLLGEARAAGMTAQMELAGRSLKGQLGQANRPGARYVAIVGEGETVLKDMQGGGGAIATEKVVEAVLRGLRERAWRVQLTAPIAELGGMAQVSRPFQIALAAMACSGCVVHCASRARRRPGRPAGAPSWALGVGLVSGGGVAAGGRRPSTTARRLASKV